MRDDLIINNWEIRSDSNNYHDDFLESIFFTGNGRMGVRGYIPFTPQARNIQEGLFIAGIFGEIKQGITDFVNLPTPVYERLFIDGQLAEISSPIHRCLNLKDGVLTATYTLAANSKEIEVEYQRFFPIDVPSTLSQRITLRAKDKMEIIIHSGILTASCNCTVPDDQTKENFETTQLSQLTNVTHNVDGLQCDFVVNGTNLEVSEQIIFTTSGLSVEKALNNSEAEFLLLTAQAESDTILTYDKVSYLYTSRDLDPRLKEKNNTANYDTLLEGNKATWADIWKSRDLIYKDDAKTQGAIRYNIFQLICNCSSKDPSVSIGARGLTHTRYKGCYFWDTDIFLLPFFIATDLEAAKNLCEYRVRNLPAAKEYARKMNLKGARYPWMASFDGSEQCETWDIGCSEVHITADVVYAISKYCEASDDKDFYLYHAAKVYIETARYWFSRYTINPITKEVDLLFCKGPDEYCGITNNNLFTNIMVKHNLKLAIQAVKDLTVEAPEELNTLSVTNEELNDWKFLYDNIKIPHDPVTGHLTTDDTFHLLEPVDIKKIKMNNEASYHNVCFDRLQRYKVVKQADLLLIMTRFPDMFTQEEKITAWNEFEPLCLHDSTLSFASHALFAAQNNLTEECDRYFKQAIFLDLMDVMNNTGKEGLHLACIGESWQVARLLTKE